MASSQELSPKQQTIAEISRGSLHLINRLRQAFPGFFDNYEVGALHINFSEPLTAASEPVVSTVYDGTNLTGVVVNKRLISEIYEELDTVAFTDLVRTNVGVAVCLDAVFQKLLNEMSDVRCTEQIMGFLTETSTVPGELARAIGCSEIDRPTIQQAWQAMIQNNGTIDEDLVISINSRRLAFGMLIAAEKDKYGAHESLSVASCVKESILGQLRKKAGLMRLVGYALTGSIDAAINGAAKSLLDPNLVPFAIPYSMDQMNDLNKRMIKAIRLGEHTYSEGLLIDLSEGYNPEGKV